MFQGTAGGHHAECTVTAAASLGERLGHRKVQSPPWLGLASQSRPEEPARLEELESWFCRDLEGVTDCLTQQEAEGL